MKKKKYEKTVFVSDLHIPYHNPIAIQLFLKFLAWFKPNFIYIIGDIIDFYMLSKFDKNPARLLSLQDELDQTKDFLKQLRQTCLKTSITLKEGNHEERLRKYLWRHPELSPLKVLNMKHLLELDDSAIKVELVNYNQRLNFHDFLITHGDMVRKFSSYTAKGQMEKKEISGISGHTHRLGEHWRTSEAGIKLWIETGCLCSLNPEYIEGIPDWQNGFTVGYWVQKNHRFHTEKIPIIKNKLFYQGMLWEV